MARRVKSRTLTVFLVKDHLSEPDEILKRSGSLQKSPVLIAGHRTGTLYIQPTDDRRPTWVDLFKGATTIDPDTVRNASTAAVWLVEIKKKTLALTFGYGRNLLKPGSYAEDFGLRITLNAVDPNKIKAIDRITLDAVAQQTRIQAIRDVSMSEFGLDVEQDLLRAVTGVPMDRTLGHRFTGRDALQVIVPIELQQIPDLLERLLLEFAKDDFKARFPWIEQIHEIDDPIKKAELDLRLVAKLKTKNLDGVWLAVPEMVDWGSLAGFRYKNSKKARIHSDIHVLTLLEEVGDPKEIDDYSLKRRYHVAAIDNDNDVVVKQWPVYRCLYCEVAAGNDTFLLNNGRWFRIATKFVDRITEAIDKIAENTLLMPPYDDKSEPAYSKRISDNSGGLFALMDLKLIGSTSLPNRIEFCDLYSTDRQIVHLKRYSSSSALSHLFAQGVVSARLFLNETDFRRELNRVLPKTHRLADPRVKPSPEKFEVVFGIISKSKKKLVLPFFSRVNLKNAYSNLIGMGFKVSVSKIPSTSE